MPPLALAQVLAAFDRALAELQHTSGTSEAAQIAYTRLLAIREELATGSRIPSGVDFEFGSEDGPHVLAQERKN